jgi:hypothetical protein
MAIHLRRLGIECKEQKNYVYTAGTRRGSFSIRRATPGPPSFVPALQTFPSLYPEIQ